MLTRVKYYLALLLYLILLGLVQYSTVILFEQCLGVAKTAGILCSR